MRYLIKIDELKDKTIFIEEQVDRLKESIENIDKAKNGILWEGVAKDSFIAKYDNYVLELNKILKNYLKLLVYLKSYYSNYNEEYLRIKKKYKDLLTEVGKNENS